MQGVVTDSKGAYVKAAIVRLLKAGDEGSGDVSVTYAETDEEGRFVIRDLDPDEKYIIEIDVKLPEPALKNVEEAEDTKKPDEGTDEPAVAAAAEEQEASEVKQETAAEEQEASEVEQETAAEEQEASEAKQEAAFVEQEDDRAEAKYAPEEVEIVLSPEIIVAEPPYNIDEADFDEEEEIFADEYIISADYVPWENKDHFTSIEYTVTENLAFSSLYNVPGFNLKDKPYLCKNNLW